MNPPPLVAHRGWPRRFPENTLLGIEAALAAGARSVEIDVQLSADQVSVLHHDRTLDRVCGVSGAVADRGVDELTDLAAFEPDRFDTLFRDEPAVRLPTLRQVVERFEAAPEVTLFVEIKRVSVEAFGADAALDAVIPVLESIRQRAPVISFSPEVVTEAKSRGWPSVGLILDTWNQPVEPGSVDWIFVNVRKVPAGDRLDGREAPVGVYDVVEPTIARTWLDRGAARVETFDIGGMLAAFDEATS